MNVGSIGKSLPSIGIQSPAVVVNARAYGLTITAAVVEPEDGFKVLDV